MNNPVRLVYILAASHSGSTLLGMLIGAHSQAINVGELKANNLGNPGNYRCSCGNLIRSCEFWRQVEQEMATAGIDFNICRAGTDYFDVASNYARWLLQPLVRGPAMEAIRKIGLTLSPTWRSRFPEIQHRNQILIDTLARIGQAKWVVDPSKIGIRLKFLLTIKDLQIKVIRLVRDGRAVALSYTDPARYADAKESTLRGHRDPECLPFEDAVREWVRSNEEADAVLNGISRDRWLLVRYEDLCRNHAETMNRIFGFINLEDQPEVVTAFRSRCRHIIGNGMRFDMDRPIELDERWKSTLTFSQMRQFNALAGQMNRRFGYDG